MHGPPVPAARPLRAIVYSDILQGLTLLLVVWIVAISSVMHFGGARSLFTAVEAVNADLLSTPGSAGPFYGSISDRVVLRGDLHADDAAPPHDAARRDPRWAKLNRMAVSIGCFVLAILLPVVIIGMYGAVRYPDACRTKTVHV